MLEMRVSHVVEQVVRQFLLPTDGGRESEAIHFQFDIDLSYWGKKAEYEFNERAGLHLLYHRKPECAAVSVFSGLTESPFDRMKEVKKWKHETSHDSCWRDINVFSQLYFGMADRINAKLEKKVAPCEMRQFNNFAMFNGLFQWVPCEVSYDPDDPHRYRRKIVLL